MVTAILARRPRLARSAMTSPRNAPVRFASQRRCVSRHALATRIVVTTLRTGKRTFLHTRVREYKVRPYLKLRYLMPSLCLVVALFGATLVEPASAQTTTVTFSAQAVSYDLAVGQNPRVLVGLLAGDQGLVAFGSVRFEFEYLGTKQRPTKQQGPTATATYRLVAGINVSDRPSEPRLIKPSQAIGVYAAENVNFDRAGKWRVIVTVRFGKKSARVPTTFTVATKHRVVNVGDAAPRTENPLVPSADVSPASIDSRASRSTPAPDQMLHSTTVASALDEGLPVVVVVSTPTYCLSQFCGPITDSVNALAPEYAGKVAFVHLEVWKNYRRQQINRAAAEWILSRDSSGDANEPWVFTIGRDGIVQQRFDNVTSDDELRAATSALVTPGT